MQVLFATWLTSQVSFTHALQPWTYLDITRRGCIRECKYPNQLDKTLNRLYPASSLVQSLYNDWAHVWIEKVTARRFHSGCVVDVAIMQLTQNQKNINIRGWRRRVICIRTPMKMSNWRDDGQVRTLSGVHMRKQLYVTLNRKLLPWWLGSIAKAPVFPIGGQFQLLSPLFHVRSKENIRYTDRKIILRFKV